MKVRLTWRPTGAVEPTEEVVDAESTCDAVTGLIERCEADGVMPRSIKAEAIDETDA